VRDGEVSGLNNLVDKHALKPSEVGELMDELKAAYECNKDADRYTATAQDVDVVVTPSGKLELEVHEIIDGILKH
jgi:hypothetical protein